MSLSFFASKDMMFFLLQTLWTVSSFKTLFVFFSFDKQVRDAFEKLCCLFLKLDINDGKRKFKNDMKKVFSLLWQDIQEQERKADKKQPDENTVWKE